MAVAPKWIAVGVGAVAGLLVGIVLGTTVFQRDEPRTTLVPITLPSTTTTTTLGPTTTVADSPLALAPSDAGAPAPTFAPCERFTATGPDLPVQLCDSGATVRLVQDLLRGNGFEIGSDGRYGPETATAVADFQGRVALPVDGVVDAFTFGALCDGSAVDICAAG